MQQSRESGQQANESGKQTYEGCNKCLEKYCLVLANTGLGVVMHNMGVGIRHNRSLRRVLRDCRGLARRRGRRVESGMGR